MDNAIVVKNSTIPNRLIVEASETLPAPVKEWLRLISCLTDWNPKTRCFVLQIPSVYRMAITAFADYNNVRLVSKVEPSPVLHNPETYEQYQLRWMSEHKRSLNMLMQELAEMQYEDPEDSDRISTPVNELFEEWEADRGFGGEIWACKAEWKDAEGGDV